MLLAAMSPFPWCLFKCCHVIFTLECVKAWMDRRCMAVCVETWRQVPKRFVSEILGPRVSVQRDWRREAQSAWGFILLYYRYLFFPHYVHIWIPALGCIFPERLSRTGSTAPGTAAERTNGRGCFSDGGEFICSNLH